MYNRGFYNRQAYNRSLAEFIWSSLAIAETYGEGTLFITKGFSAEVAAESAQTSALTRIFFFDGSAEAETYSEGEYLRTRFFYSSAAAEAFAYAEGLNKYQKQSIEIPLVNMTAGDELIIDTDAMMVYLNGESILDKVDESSIFFKLKYGENDLSFMGDGMADIKVKHKGRWL